MTISRPTSSNAPSNASRTPSPPSSSATICRGAGSSSPSRRKTAPAARAAFSDPAAHRVHAPAAALANGALAHAFEMDNLTWPSTGVHPGATLLAAGLAVAQERGIGGRELIAAFVAGSEVMIRIGRATHHSNEGRGFHAPGTTGPFGAAVACGRLMGFDAERMRNALGSCGLARLRAAGVRALRHRRDGEAPASRTRRRKRRAGGEPRRRRLHRPGERARRRVRLPAGILRRRFRPGRAHAWRSARAMPRARSCSSASPATSPRIRRCRRSWICAPSTAMPAPTSPRSTSPATTGWRASTTSPPPPTS